MAIKVLHRSLANQDQIVKRFLMEARAASMIRHPSIVDVTDFGQLPDGCSFFVMEFLDGPNLGDVIADLGALPLYRSVNILKQVCRALGACHAKGIAHRDLKPENIVLLQREGHRDLVALSPERKSPVVRSEKHYAHVKILDFGVAKIQEATAALDYESRSKGMVFGSPYYVSPEQAIGESGDYRSDIYSLGIIFFEMLTGEVPFEAASAQEIMVMHTRNPVPSVRAIRADLKLPPEADFLIEKATQKSPRDRHRSSADFLRELDNCFGDVIYGRDIDRYLEVTGSRIEPPVATKGTVGIRTVTPRQLQVNEELTDLFMGRYESPSAITETTYEAINPAPPRPPRTQAKSQTDQAAVKAELDGLFPTSEDD